MCIEVLMSDLISTKKKIIKKNVYIILDNNSIEDDICLRSCPY